MQQNSTKPASLIALISVFFFWGFLAASNGIFIPFCKTHFSLSQFQSQLVDFAFYVAYFIGSLSIYTISLSSGRDLINSIGYKKTIIIGLGISVVGALVMLPAVNSGSFVFILAAFFVIALGFSLQQTSANPLVLNLGDPARGANRLNLAGSINSWGTTVGPILVSLVLFGKIVASDVDKTSASIGSINILYVILAFAFAAAIVILAFAKIKGNDIEIVDTETKVLRQPLLFVTGILIVLVLLSGMALLSSVSAEAAPDKALRVTVIAGFGILLTFFLVMLLQLGRKIRKENRFEQNPYPQVTLGMIAIFVYVGVEVTIQSNMGALLRKPEFGSLDSSAIGPYISLYWGSLMIGRWTAAIGAFKTSRFFGNVLTVVIPFLAFAVVLFMNRLSGADAGSFMNYSICVVILIAAFMLGRQRPAFSLMLFAALGTIAMLIGLFTTGKIATYAFLSGGLFCSIMWPCIFSLAIAGLGKYTSQASGFLIMMILGGAFIPPLQGLLADYTDIHISYVIPVFCFAFLAWYAFRMKHILSGRGINYDEAASDGH